jgi:hypothetical protein
MAFSALQIKQPLTSALQHAGEPSRPPRRAPFAINLFRAPLCYFFLLSPPASGFSIPASHHPKWLILFRF